MKTFTSNYYTVHDILGTAVAPASSPEFYYLTPATFPEPFVVSVVETWSWEPVLGRWNDGGSYQL